MGSKAIASVRKLLAAEMIRWFDAKTLFWYALSLLFAGYYGYLVLQQAFLDSFVVQDDARQHVFWMQQWLDSDLLHDDFMADYFEAQSPIGFTALYRIAATAGIHPFTFNKILPPILGLLTTHYCFRFSLQILPLPAAAFTSTLLLNQSLWMRDDLVSGTPRAFVYVLLLAFLFYVHHCALLPCWFILVLQPLFYPHTALLSAGVLIFRLLKWQRGRLVRTRDVKDYALSGVGLIILIGLLAPYALAPETFGPLVSAAQARTMPEFWPGGRAAYFTENPILFWFGDRSGFMPTPVLTPPTLAFSLVFPWLWWRSRQHPWISTIKANAAILQQWVLASFGLYFAAHLMLFEMHLPSRYTHHSLRIIFALTASFAIWILLDYWLRTLEAAAKAGDWLRQGLIMTAIAFVSIAVVGYSALTNSFPFTNNRHGDVPDLYRFLRTTPPNSLIASLTKETSNLHTFAQRSPLVSPELGLPYHLGYYKKFRQRSVDLITAQYSPDLRTVQKFIQKYGIDLWLLDDQILSVNHLANNSWFQQYQPAAQQAIAHLTNPAISLALEEVRETCTLFTTSSLATQTATKLAQDNVQNYWLLDAQCILSLETNSD